ncbi:hypothetical protein CON36_33115 [Bacillus cereus]|uniref:Uncharacterized protein n=1 Tax=Bacillus cereus TaxID=1396 RepID=A0A9X6STC3_BACCE|nr:hypothetical protein [Bacillus cereus]PDZ94576.1 hypothetical protein CON36_33115 [Bacillus cereus]
MNTWGNWIHPREQGQIYFSSVERMNQLFDLAEEKAKDWYTTEARYYFNHNTESSIAMDARINLRNQPATEAELKFMYDIVHNYLPCKDTKITLGWLRQQFNINLFDPFTEKKYIDKILRSLHDTSTIVEMSSIFDIKKTDRLEGDRELAWMWKNVETDGSEFEMAYDEVIHRLKELITDNDENVVLYKNYLKRLYDVKEKMADEVIERKLNHKKRLNHQFHQEPLNDSGEYGFIYQYMDEEDKKTVRHFLIHAQHIKTPMVYATKNATYYIHYQGEKVVGKSAYKYEPVKERRFTVDIQTANKKIEGIRLLVVPELVTGKATFKSETKPGEVFSSKVYHPKYKKVVRVKKGLYSGKYYLYLDYPKYTDKDGILVYKNQELFSEDDSDTSSKTVEVLLKLIAKAHNRKQTKKNM